MIEADPAKTPTWLDVILDRVSYALVQDPKWRRPLPPTSGPRASEATKALSALLRGLPATLGPLDARELCEFFQVRRAAFGANPTGVARSFGLAKGATLKRRSGKRPSDRRSPVRTEPWVLASRRRRVELDVDAPTVPFLAWIATHPHPARFTMTEALRHGGLLTREEVITLLELLTRHEILELEAPAGRGSGSAR